MIRFGACPSLKRVLMTTRDGSSPAGPLAVYTSSQTIACLPSAAASACVRPVKKLNA